MSISVNQTFFVRLKTKPIWLFFFQYDAYYWKARTSGLQFRHALSDSVEPERPIYLVFCIEVGQLELFVYFGMIHNCFPVEDLMDVSLWSFLE